MAGLHEKLKPLLLQFRSMRALEQVDGVDADKNQLFLINVAAPMISDPEVINWLLNHPKLVAAVKLKYGCLIAHRGPIYLQHRNTVDALYQRLMELPI